MKKFYTILSLLLTSSLYINAQLLPPNQPEQNSCDALVLCGNTFTSPYAYQGRGTTYDLTNTPCSGGEDNVMWIRLNVNTAGTIVFTLAPLIGTDDYDFAVVNMTGKACNAITTNDVIRCNFNNNSPGSNVNGVIGLNTTSTINTVAGGTFGSSFLAPINAQPGDVYLIMINNFGYYSGVGGPTSGFTIDFTGSTATFNQPPAPKFEQILPACNHSNSIVVQLDQMIKCSSIATDGSDFLLNNGGTIASAVGLNCTGAAGYTNQVRVNFASTLNNGTYTLRAKNGTDNNTLLNLCDVGVSVNESISFQVGIDPIGIVKLDTPACQFQRIYFNTPFACNTVALDGSDFEIVGPSQVNIVSATPVNCANNYFTNQVEFRLSSPIYVDGVYTLRIKNGTDNNTLADTCGRMVIAGSSINFTINSYNGKLQAYPDDYACYFNQVIDLTSTNRAKAPNNGFNYLWTSTHPITNPNVARTTGIAEHVINTFHLQTIDTFGCVLRDSATITVKIFNAVVSPKDPKICEDETIILTVNSGNTFQWTNPTTAPNSLSSTAGAQVTAAPTVGVHNYVVKSTNDRGCEDIDSVTVTVIPKPIITATYHDTTIKIGESIILSATGGVDYNWDPIVRINNHETASPTVNPIKPTMYHVTGRNEMGCPNYDSVWVNIDYNGNLFIPNAFTPNGDGLNDEFGIMNIAFEKLHNFQIFDRYGKEVFQTQDWNKKWNGKYNDADDAPNGVYFYHIQIGQYNSEMKTYKGDVSLIR